MFKVIIFILFIFFDLCKSQRFILSDQKPNCKAIKNTDFLKSQSDSISEKQKYIFRFRNNKMIEEFQSKDFKSKKYFIIESKLKSLDNCTFEAEIRKIKTNLIFGDNFFYIGKKTIYKIVETSDKYIILEYSCNEYRNTCTEILYKQ